MKSVFCLETGGEVSASCAQGEVHAGYIIIKFTNMKVACEAMSVYIFSHWVRESNGEAEGLGYTSH